jgi:hypothetical protein
MEAIWPFENYPFIQEWALEYLIFNDSSVDKTLDLVGKNDSGFHKFLTEKSKEYNLENSNSNRIKKKYSLRAQKK